MATDLDTAKFNYENYRYCYDNGHRDWLVKAARCFAFWSSKQWSDEDRAKLRRAGRPALTFNIIESLTRAMLGAQRALRNDVRFSPVHDASGASADVQDTLWMHIQGQNQFDFLETDTYLRGLITGRAYYDVRADFENQLQGEAKIWTPRSQDVVLDPCFTEYDPKEWPQVNVVRWTNLLDIQHKFGKAKAEKLRYSNAPGWYDIEDSLLAGQLGRIPYYGLGFTNGQYDEKLVRALKVIDRQYYVLKRKEMFVDTETGDMSEIPETWKRNRIAHVLQNTPGLTTMYRMVKTVHWTVTCEDVVLHDEDSPYSAFTIVPYFPTMLDGITVGAVENLLDPQMLYNKVTSQELHIINTTANSGWISKVGNIKNYTAEQMETYGSQTGLYLEVADVTQTEKIQPNQTPVGHDRISNKADGIMRNMAGMPNGARGFAREDVASEAILSNQAATDINFAGWLGNLHRSKQLLAMRVMDCVQTYYTETRVIMINRGTTFRPEYEQLTINQPTPEGEMINDVTKGKYTTVLIPSPARADLSEGEFKTLVELRTKVGLQIPDDVMIELAPIGQKMALIKKLKGDTNEAQAQMQAQQARIAELEAELTQAQVEKEQSAAALNQARANKAEVEAQTDPDAAYERVEMARIKSDARIEQQRLGIQRRTADRSDAIKLTQIDAENKRHTQTLVADVAKAAVKPKPQPKPAGAKPNGKRKVRSAA